MKKPFLLASLAAALVVVSGAAVFAQDAKGDRQKRFEAMFERLDANKDGTVSRAEYLAAAEARFDRIDTNDDGQITLEELQAVRKRNK